MYRTHTHIKLFIKKQTRKLFSFHIWFPYCQMIDSSHTWRILAHLPQTRWSTHIDDTYEWWMRNSHSSWSFRCFFCCCCFIFHSCSYHNGVWNLRACSRTQFFCVFCWLIGCRKVYLNEIQQFFFLLLFVFESSCYWLRSTFCFSHAKRVRRLCFVSTILTTDTHTRGRKQTR